VATTGHGPLDNLLWQAAVGAWPIPTDRLLEYATKAAREASESTHWQHPDADFEAGLARLAEAANGAARPIITGFVDEIIGFGRSNSLSAKLLQLTGPGVPDVYQGTELWDLSLVDPDNRRPVDFAARERMLEELDAQVAAGTLPPVDDSGRAKLLVTSRALRLRRDHPECFTAYRPVTAQGTASAHVIGAHRGGVTAVATRLPALEKARRDLHKRDQLPVENGHENDGEDDCEHQEEDSDERGRGEARQAISFQPVRQRVEKISNRHARHERQKNALQQPEHENEDADHPCPDGRLPLNAHAPCLM